MEQSQIGGRDATSPLANGVRFSCMPRFVIKGYLVWGYTVLAGGLEVFGTFFIFPYIGNNHPK